MSTYGQTMHRTDSAPNRVGCSFTMRDNKWVRLLANLTGLINQR